MINFFKILGLGGAYINILCFPDYIRINDTVNVKLYYQIYSPRNSVLHFHALDEKTKTYYAGNEINLNNTNGCVDINLTLPSFAKNPILWKIFISPENETFPNMLAETGISTQISDYYTNSLNCIDCPFINKIDFKPFVIIKNLYKNATSLNFQILYNTNTTAEISVHLMDRNTNNLLKQGTTQLVNNKGELSVSIDTINITNYYLLTTLIEPNKTWENRLAEDRKYNLLRFEE